MSTPVHEPSSQSAPPEAPQAEEPAGLIELGCISDTEGGIRGATIRQGRRPAIRLIRTVRRALAAHQRWLSCTLTPRPSACTL